MRRPSSTRLVFSHQSTSISLWLTYSSFIQYPAAFQVYRNYCLQYLQHITTYPIPDLRTDGLSSTSVRSPLGTALIIRPQAGDYEFDRKNHWVVCLFTSYHYGTRADPPDLILSHTYAALLDLRRKLDALKKANQDQPTGLFACRFNSGAFRVPWERTRGLVEAVGLEMTVMTPEEQDNQGSPSQVAQK